jgi:hypothetical protein
VFFGPRFAFFFEGLPENLEAVASSGHVQAKLEAEVKQRCQSQRAGGAQDSGTPSAKELELFHSMGIAGMPLLQCFCSKLAVLGDP